MSLSFGYIIEFDGETGSGVIEEATTKRRLSVYLNDIKQRSRRYLTEKKEFIGELFDFDITTKQNVTDEDALQAKNVRHRALYCPVENCSRLTAFTNKKALDDHVNIRHILKEEKRQLASSSTNIVVEQPKKQRRVRPKPTLISLSYDRTDAVVGRFIGKQGVNIKRFEQQNRIQIQLLDTQKQLQSIQIRIRPLSHGTFDVEAITKQLKLEWERCIVHQRLHEQIRSERLRVQFLRKGYHHSPVLEIEKDSRHENHFKFLQTKRSKRQKWIQQSKQHQTIQHKQFHCHESEKLNKDMKNHQWRINEQLLDLA